jgi:hypothetical protein
MKKHNQISDSMDELSRMLRRYFLILDQDLTRLIVRELVEPIRYTDGDELQLQLREVNHYDQA